MGLPPVDRAGARVSGDPSRIAFLDSFCVLTYSTHVSDSASAEHDDVLRQFVLIIMDRQTSTVTFMRWDRRQISFPLTSSLFTPDSPFRRIRYVPLHNILLLETIHGESIAAELPTEEDPAPVRGRPIIYLDQKDWSSLAKALYEPKRVQPTAEREAANKIIDLARRRKIILPISAGHMSETCKWSNIRERYRLALTILELSGGWQMRDPLDVRRYELRRSLLERFQDTQLPQQNVFTLEPHAINSGRRSQEAPSQFDDLPPRMAFILEALTSIMASFDTMLDTSWAEAGTPATGWVERFQEYTDWLATTGRSTAQRRKSISMFFIADTRIEIAEEARAADITVDTLGDWIDQYLDEDINAMPCLGLFREVLQQKHLDPGTTWFHNDLIDLMYITCAAGYADYVVGDNSLVSQIEPSLRRLNRPMNAYRRLRDLVLVLEDAGYWQPEGKTEH